MRHLLVQAAYDRVIKNPGLVVQKIPYQSYRQSPETLTFLGRLTMDSNCDSRAEVEQFILRAESNFVGLSANIVETKWLKD